MEVDIDQIRKVAAQQAGCRVLEERFGAPKLATVDEVLLQKAASADRELLNIAAAIRPNNIMAAYEDLGGAYSQKAEE